MILLWKKLARDLRANWGQFLAVVIVIALGSSFFIASFSSYQGVITSLQRTYHELAMPTYWVNLAGEGPAVLMPGTELRETAQVVLELNQGKKTGAQVVGLPLDGPQFSKLKLITGAWPGENQILLEAAFAKAHALKAGDTIGVRNGERVYHWVVSGTAGSPEYIWPVMNRFVPVPTPRFYGVGYVTEKQLIRDLQGLQHEILVGSTNINSVTTYLKAQGVKISDMYALADQPSNQVLQLMLRGFGKVAAVLPWLFLLSAGLATYALLSVLVKAQKAQIKTLQYLGLAQWHILTHYLSFALLVGVLGSSAGCLIGAMLSTRLTGALAGIIGLPFVAGGVPREIIIITVVSCIFAACLGGLSPALYSSRLREQKQIVVASWQRYIPMSLRIPINNVRRDPRNALFSVAVIALGVAIVTVGLFIYQSVVYSAQKQYSQYQAYDLKVQFRTILKEEVISEIAAIPGVTDVNPGYELPVWVQKGSQRISSLLVGMRGDMLRLENRQGAMQ
ncbi:MAG: ABC transporter permease, partial [Peptococcaceae bacterium]|nr:ABC transporter permease [Peptococcaceae bacterium]